MSFEQSFNNDFAKYLSKLSKEERDGAIDHKFIEFKKRLIEMDEARSKMAEGYKIVLEGLRKAYPSLDLEDANIKDSPDRMARALLEICSGLGADASEIFSTSFPAEKYNQVVILRDISFTSMCSHHFIPFTGMAHVGYLPSIDEDTKEKVSKHQGRVVGLSKLARIVDVYAQRPQLQERLSFNIMTAIDKHLSPSGVMVVVEGMHGCLNCRGAKKETASMFTSALHGAFKTDKKLRSEFLSLINHVRHH